MDSMRLDKWLWVARFYKTRSLAGEAVNGGKVHLNGERSKAGRLVVLGSELKIRKGPYEFIVEIIGFSKHRGPAKEAQLLYKEREESLQARALLRQQLKVEMMGIPKSGGKPDKQTRRELIKVKQYKRQG